MAEVVLFHSVLGLRPDYYGGEVFDDLDDGLRKEDALGYQEITRRAREAVAGLVFAGFSLGAVLVELLAASRPGVLGAVLMHGAVPVEGLSEFGVDRSGLKGCRYGCITPPGTPGWRWKRRWPSARPPTHLVPVNHTGPVERARQPEGLGFLGIPQPLGLDFRRAWKRIGWATVEHLPNLQGDPNETPAGPFHPTS